MQKKSGKNHSIPETAEQKFKRIGEDVNNQIILDERKEAGKNISDESPFKKLLAVFKDGKAVLTSDEKAQRGIK